MERKRAIAALGASAVLAGAGFLGVVNGRDGGQDATTTAASLEAGDAFLTAVRVNGYDKEPFSSLSDMFKSADLVVRGNLRDFRLDYVFRGDAPGGELAIATAALDANEVLRGRMSQPTVTVAFSIPEASEDDAQEIVQRAGRELPKGEVLLFLRDIRPESPGTRYRLINSSGMWAATTRSQLDTPSSVATPQESDSPFFDDVRGVQDIDGLAALLRQGPREP